MKQVIILLSTLMLSATAVAQNDRSDMWEFGLIISDMSSEALSADMGSSIAIDGDTGFGLSVAYNISNRFAVGADFIWSSPKYTAVLTPDGPGIPEVINHKMDLFTYTFTGTWNLLDGPLTPYLEANYGWTNIDSNIADQPPITGCWWDPWWGYVCDTFYSTYSKTRTSYGGAAGLRWDSGNGWTLKASYGFLEIDTSKATEKANMDVIRVDLAWLF
ncbi:MAG: porin family protein [Proteobacteria bacterium]|nr:porin family protein [Pseudomonadota bacterium]